MMGAGAMAEPQRKQPAEQGQVQVSAESDLALLSRADVVKFIVSGRTPSLSDRQVRDGGVLSIAKELGYHVTQNMDLDHLGRIILSFRRPSAEFGPLDALSSPPALPEFGRVNEFNARAVLDSWKANATYENLGRCWDALQEMKNDPNVPASFLREAFRFLLPYGLGRTALYHAEQAVLDPHYFSRRFKPYVVQVHDCFTYLTDIVNEVRAMGPGPKPRTFYAVPKVLQDGRSQPANALSQDFYVCCKTYPAHVLQAGGAVLDLQVGDMLMVDNSPISIKHDHWGYVVERQGELWISQRGRDGLMSLEEFLSKNYGIIEIRRPFGYSGYGQHFQVTLNLTDEKIGRGQIPIYKTVQVQTDGGVVSKERVVGYKRDVPFYRLQPDIKLVDTPEPMDLAPQNLAANKQ